jgi:hypothetical protein
MSKGWTAATPYFHRRTHTYEATPEVNGHTHIGPYYHRPYATTPVDGVKHYPGSTSSQGPSSYQNSQNNYNAKPWDGLDKNKFPRTYGWMVKFFFSGEYHRDTKYVYIRPETAKTTGETKKEDRVTGADAEKAYNDYLAKLEGYQGD